MTVSINAATATALSFLAYEEQGEGRDSFDDWVTADEFESGEFYARAFQDGGEIVIAIRGTDSAAELQAASLWASLPIPWLSTELKDELRAAFGFYQDVVTDNPTSEVGFTGHSLGGGLAAVMAVITGTAASVVASIPSRALLEWVIGDIVDDVNSDFAGSVIATQYATEIAAFRLGGPISAQDLDDFTDAILSDYGTNVGDIDNFRMRDEVAGRFTLDSSRISDDAFLNGESGDYYWDQTHETDRDDSFIQGFIGQEIALHHQGLHAFVGSLDAVDRAALATVESFVPQVLNTLISDAAGFTGTSEYGANEKFLSDLMENHFLAGSQPSIAGALAIDGLQLSITDTDSLVRVVATESALAGLAVHNAAWRLAHELDPTGVLLVEEDALRVDLRNSSWGADGSGTSSDAGADIYGLEQLYSLAAAFFPSTGVSTAAYAAWLEEGEENNPRSTDWFYLPAVASDATINLAAASSAGELVIAIGTDGADTFLDAGDSVLLGGEGDDTFVLASSDVTTIVMGGVGADLVSFESADHGILFSRDDFDAGSGALPRIVTAIFDVETIQGTEFDDQLIVDGALNVRGGGGGDILYGDAETFLLDTVGDASALPGGYSPTSGAAYLQGDDGNDFLDCSAAATLDGGAGYDVASFKHLNGGATFNVTSVTTNSGHTLISIENLIGTAFADTFAIADDSEHFLAGGEGSDTFEFSSSVYETTVLFLGAGADTVVADSSVMQFITILDGSASDIIFDSVKSLNIASIIANADRHDSDSDSNGWFEVWEIGHWDFSWEPGTDWRTDQRVYAQYVDFDGTGGDLGYFVIGFDWFDWSGDPDADGEETLLGEGTFGIELAQFESGDFGIDTSEDGYHFSSTTMQDDLTAWLALHGNDASNAFAASQHNWDVLFG